MNNEVNANTKKGTKNQIQLRGMFKKIISGGESNNWLWALAIFVSDEGENHTVYCKGRALKLMTHYDVVLSENFNDKYKNKNLVSLSISQPKNNEELKKVLLRTNTGIGRATIEKLDKQFGEDWIDSFLKNPEIFKEKINEKTFTSLDNFFKTYTNKSYNFFLSHGLEKLYDALKIDFSEGDLIEELKKINPYTLVYTHNYSFSKIDDLGIALELHNSIERLYALIYHSIEKEINSNNSTKIKINYILEAVKTDFLNYSDKVILDAITYMINNAFIVYWGDTGLFSTHSIVRKENYIAVRLSRLKKIALKISNYQAHSSISKLQQEAFMNAIINSVSVISGFPGTGKSFVIKNIIEFLISEKLFKKEEIVIVTPTGRAAVNLKAKSGVDAKTIHSYFKISDTPFKSTLSCQLTENTHKVLVIDEFSMVNTDLFYTVLYNSPDLEKLILVGDADQLPCIGAGNLLDDIIESNKFQTTKLVEIFRTDHRDIAEHFLAVREFKEPRYNTENIEWYDANNIDFKDKLLSIYQEKVDRFGIQNVALLIPLHKTPHGTIKMNMLLQEWNLYRQNLNIEDIPSIKIGAGENAKIFYLGDKVVQNENDYDLNVYNGEIGFIESIDKEGKKITINFDYKKIEYSRDQFIQYITLGYALTVHKFQGSESSCVIFPVLPEYDYLFETKLIYTAVSRSKENLVILGDLGYYREKVLKGHKKEKTLTNFADSIQMEELWNL
ncbi:exodeoxyribonuclease V alpha chain [Mycoplasmopsis californica HAZ160_1]|uniref:Exodeoxyribonuclease V alpha chain n=1 Tax=Mycoplasmopsis californica HAZ160_1 TaxID=1397850 RepID=A0AAT9F7B6_9BACT|nr:AAA family ATPase [Mycoplasmopsis californica]BAP00776.1 exodeoxyribonuclease V alpha chain [Mycoplasmopsis californica HAZ160_1]BBG40630.1 exodeoxyribonuclease V alpha chain [Mycoplasmopsis californica]BBG41225.1 exodeoxyribonuclease V alpha chain [Mycoplasmopsis californica]BBG41818.1 exodeoxyribonuclease V alpha chain [Mycoplasmopsis californica]BBG42412.1 exodeoxyribonuclease V alpha chain [Mycoplasmopsis californica]